MLHLLFTLDYEVHGNGDGSPLALMVEPTDRMLAQFDRHGARLTIMADIAEVLRFQEHRDATGRDDYDFERIAAQLRNAVARRHDVQLHLHTSWFGARLEDGRWQQNFDNYSFADLDERDIDAFVGRGKRFLEDLLQPVEPGYRCHAFRAANWSMQPSRRACTTLLRHGFDVETSVFKWGQRQGLVNFDYSQAPHACFPWRASTDDVCKEDPASPLWEIPIYAEHRRVPAFLSWNRIYRAVLGRLHRLPRRAPGAGGPAAPRRSATSRLRWLLQRHAWKADFNQCTGRQLIAALERARRQADRERPGQHVPFVLIGHSKLFTRENERNLEPFLGHVAARPQQFRFSRFADVLSHLNPVPAAT